MTIIDRTSTYNALETTEPINLQEHMEQAPDEFLNKLLSMPVLGHEDNVHTLHNTGHESLEHLATEKVSESTTNPPISLFPPVTEPQRIPKVDSLFPPVTEPQVTIGAIDFGKVTITETPTERIPYDWGPNRAQRTLRKAKGWLKNILRTNPVTEIAEPPKINTALAVASLALFAALPTKK